MIEHDAGLAPPPPFLPDAEPAATDPAQPTPLALTFTGSGAEYFRIWIVNLLLTVATLGIYSAWAKTRRLQYFYRNTSLAGASFDFRGNPKAILRGRLLAVGLLGAYQYAFGFSLVVGAVVVGLLLAGLPFLMRSALRFRLSNTYYRGLPFGFCGGIKDAYLVYLAPVAMFVVPGALVALMPNKPFAGAFFLLYLCWPLMHGAMRVYQHKHLMYGDQQAGFPLANTTLAKPYLRAFLGGLGLTVVFFGALVAWFFFAGQPQAAGLAGALPVIAGMILLYLYVLLSGPFIMVRMNNLAWSATSFPGVTIHCALRARSYLRLQVVNVLLTLLTLGLFRPFAVVRTWRYRVDHLHVEAPQGFEHAVLHAARRKQAAAGDGVADFLGVDLSW